MPSPETGFETVGSEVRYRGRILEVEQRHLRGPDGTVVERDVVTHPGSVAVLLHEAGQVLLIRQHRVAVGQSLVELPAGLRDRAGEPPETTAARECEEEAGLIPRRLTLMSSYYATPGYSDEFTMIYLGEDLQRVDRHPEGIEERAAELLWVPVSEALAMAARGAISHATTLMALLLFAQRQET